MKKINLLVFDLDGTLYNLDDVVGLNYKMQLDFYSEVMSTDYTETVAIFEENGIFPVIQQTSKSATEFFIKSGIPIEKWNEYRELHFDVRYINRENAASDYIISLFESIAPIVLLSSNSKNNIIRILEHIGIKQAHFEEIICSDNKYAEGSFNKLDEIKLIAKRKMISTENILSIGERYKTDVEPIISLNGMGVIVKGANQLLSVYDALKTDIFDNIEIYNI